MMLLYKLVCYLLTPFVWLYLQRRCASGKEDKARLGERLGKSSLERPPGLLLWIHGASVGEALSALNIIEAVQAKRTDIKILVTSGTVTSANIMAKRLPPGVLHQYYPVDLPQAVSRFIRRWHPDFAIFIESELWPNMLGAIKHSNTKAVLVNARLSENSYKLWRMVPWVIRKLLSSFSVCFVQTKTYAEKYKNLGCSDVRIFGNLKFLSKPSPYDAATFDKLRTTIGNRKVWLMASSFAGEEKLAASVHNKLRAEFPDLLTVIIPRHATRGSEIAAELSKEVSSVKLRSKGETPDRDCQIYIADTMGETGLFYRLIPVVCMAKSLLSSPGGGQNPIEPAQLGAAVLHGPYVQNFEEIYAEMDKAGAALLVKDANELSSTIARLLKDDAERTRLSKAALAVLEKNRTIVQNALNDVVKLLPGPL